MRCECEEHEIDEQILDHPSQEIVRPRACRDFWRARAEANLAAEKERDAWREDAERLVSVLRYERKMHGTATHHKVHSCSCARMKEEALAAHEQLKEAK